MVEKKKTDVVQDFPLREERGANVYHQLINFTLKIGIAEVLGVIWWIDAFFP